ncbi:hypothetical protein [Pseudonocardia pini]|uniref:hypothetical protein n=1 Tax=Pseudonocardia pini TaxID=2758030 RepID=UPI0015F12217|nr:hypothetical protein [Pseudonocardia pini]
MSSGAVGFLYLVFFGGILVSGFVLRARAGIGIWRGMKVFGPGGFGIGWTATAAVCAAFWPITLVVWLVRGMPEPRVVFNEKALERRRRSEAEGSGV